MKYFIASPLIFLCIHINVFCQTDSIQIKRELLLITAVPFKYNKGLDEKESKFFDIPYLSILKKGTDIIPTLLKLITDTTKTKILNKCSNDYFTVGQLVYVLIDDIERIPFFEVTKIQADVILHCSVFG
ncbi:MAG TPA: hypothetical protein VKT28_00970 [Puia sp.]|nr:hypothetical protein [Puia sp.]